MKLQKAAMNFVAQNMIQPAEKEKLRKVFQVLDKDMDGTLSKEEIVAGLNRLGMTNCQ